MKRFQEKHLCQFVWPWISTTKEIELQEKKDCHRHFQDLQESKVKK
jgi:hypothetical protein